MGEAKRRARALTLDGGPPSAEPIILRIDIFAPWLLLVDPLRIRVVDEWRARLRRLPSPLCSACDHTFGPGEAAPLVWFLLPEFPKGQDLQIVSGIICDGCGARERSDLVDALLKNLRSLAPGGLKSIQCGSA